MWPAKLRLSLLKENLQSRNLLHRVKGQLNWLTCVFWINEERRTDDSDLRLRNFELEIWTSLLYVYFGIGPVDWLILYFYPATRDRTGVVWVKFKLRPTGMGASWDRRRQPTCVQPDRRPLGAVMHMHHEKSGMAMEFFFGNYYLKDLTSCWIRYQVPEASTAVLDNTIVSG